jgi:hypothetical protein
MGVNLLKKKNLEKKTKFGRKKKKKRKMSELRINFEPNKGNKLFQP